MFAGRHLWESVGRNQRKGFNQFHMWWHFSVQCCGYITPHSRLMKPFSSPSTPSAVSLRLFTLPSSSFLLLNQLGYVRYVTQAFAFLSPTRQKLIHRHAQVSTLRFVLALNFGGFCVILLLSRLLAQGSTRVKVLGWICVAFSVSVFAAPLSIMVNLINYH